jgi:deaminated glutathione amidase
MRHSLFPFTVLSLLIGAFFCYIIAQNPFLFDEGMMKIAALQLNSGADINKNISDISILVEGAAQQGAQAIFLPENCFQMEEPGQGAQRIIYTPETHPGIKAAEKLAKTHHIWLLVGSVALKVDDSGKTVNRSLLLDDKGRIAAQYDKIHLFDVELPNGETYAESARFLAGDKAVLTQTPWAKIGMTVCYDVRFAHLYRMLAQAGAEILTVPAAFTAVTGEAHWHVLLRARAIENGCYVVAPAQVGTHPGNRKTYGHALIVDPWGHVLADAGSETGMVWQS